MFGVVGIALYFVAVSSENDSMRREGGLCVGFYTQ
jgi:hypothetical protein